MRPFTDRVTPLRPEGAYAVLAQAQALEAQGRKIIHLEIGQPDFPTPANVSEAGIAAIHLGKTKYTPPAGIPQFREIIADYAGRQRGLKLDPAQVVVGSGSKPGLFFPTLALVAPGDEVLYPDPGFPTYEAMIRVAGGIPVPVPLREENQFSFDLDVFDEKISDRTKLIVLNSPGNPTGGVIPVEDLKHIAEKARKHNCWVLSDEIYTQLVYDGTKAHSIAEVDGMLERTVIVDGFSKTYSMTGWRLGYMITPVALAERLELLITHATGCTAAFTQYAGMEALTGPQDFVAEMVTEYQTPPRPHAGTGQCHPRRACAEAAGSILRFPECQIVWIEFKGNCHPPDRRSGRGRFSGNRFRVRRRGLYPAGVRRFDGDDRGGGG